MFWERMILERMFSSKDCNTTLRNTASVMLRQMIYGGALNKQNRVERWLAQYQVAVNNQNVSVIGYSLKCLGWRCWHLPLFLSSCKWAITWTIFLLYGTFSDNMKLYVLLIKDCMQWIPLWNVASGNPCGVIACDSPKWPLKFRMLGCRL